MTDVGSTDEPGTVPPSAGGDDSPPAVGGLSPGGAVPAGSVFVGFRCVNGHPASEPGQICPVCGEATVAVQAVPVATKTDGMSIASLVLAIVWLGGAGSAAAVVFAAMGRKTIKRSGGLVRGEALATAGLVVGVIGLLGAGVFWGFVAVKADHAANDAIRAGKAINKVGNAINSLIPHTYTVALGQANTLKPTSADLIGGGLTSMTISSYTAPVQSLPSVTFLGEEYATVDVESCTGSSGSQSGPSPLGFALLFGTTADNATLIGAVSPDVLTQVGGIPDNQCREGIATFVISAGTTPTAVRYEPDIWHKYLWTISGS